MKNPKYNEDLEESKRIPLLIVKGTPPDEYINRRASATETTTQTQQTATDVQASSNADKVSNAPKKEEIKDEGSKDTQNDFKKFLKSRKIRTKSVLSSPSR